MNKINIRDGWVIWEPNFFPVNEANEHFSYLMGQLPWSGGSIKLFGKEYEIPRRQAFFADHQLNYAYSGKSLTKSPWDEQVLQVKSGVEKFSGTSFNACLANLYRDGADSNGWHADDEKELGNNPIIGSVSFGTTRVFQLKHNKTKEKLSFDLTHGSLLIMGGEMQHNWKHQIPKRKKVTDSRVNLTFRKIMRVNSF